jgi:hypothetical protein
MAGGGIMTDEDGNILKDENGDVIVAQGLPYVVGYWNYMIEPEWWELYGQYSLLDSPTHCLQIHLDDEDEYEAVGVYVNNHPYTYYATLYGYATARPLNQPGDYLKLIFHGVNPDGSESGKSVAYFMAKFEDGHLIQNNKWEWLDLSSLGVIGGLYCTLETTDANSWGPLSPMYFCMDKLQVKTKEVIPFVPVTDIINVPATIAVGEPKLLTGTVIPENATHKTIVWSVKDAGTTGATINNNILTTLNTGTVEVTATIIDGKGLGEDFIKDFSIEVVDSVTIYIITATVDNPNYGKIDPAGEVEVEEGGSVTFSITPFENYKITDVLVNDVSQGAIATYTFENVHSNGTIYVVFDKLSINDNVLSKVDVFSYQNSIVIKNVETILSVEILNMNGQLVYQTRVNNSETVITMNIPNGIYFVKLISQNREYVSIKILIIR